MRKSDSAFTKMETHNNKTVIFIVCESLGIIDVTGKVNGCELKIIESHA